VFCCILILEGRRKRGEGKDKRDGGEKKREKEIT
jgi:hypothetical protein